MAINYYRWDDPSAPSLSGESGKLIDLLDACLINGYGSKTGAGWTKVYYDAPNHTAVYRHSTDDCFIRIDDNQTDHGLNQAVANVRCYKTMSDVDNGTVKTPSDSQISTVYSFIRKSNSANTTTEPWILVENNGLIYFNTNYNSNTNSAIHTIGKVRYFNPSDTYPYGLGACYTGHTTYRERGYNTWMSASDGYSYFYTLTQYDGADNGRLKPMLESAFSGTTFIGNSNQGLATVNPITGSHKLLPVILYEVHSADSTRFRRGSLPGAYYPDALKVYSESAFGIELVDSNNDRYVHMISNNYGGGYLFIKLTGTWEF